MVSQRRCQPAGVQGPAGPALSTMPRPALSTNTLAQPCSLSQLPGRSSLLHQALLGKVQGVAGGQTGHQLLLLGGVVQHLQEKDWGGAGLGVRLGESSEGLGAPACGSAEGWVSSMPPFVKTHAGRGAALPASTLLQKSVWLPSSAELAGGR